MSLFEVHYVEIVYVDKNSGRVLVIIQAFALPRLLAWYMIISILTIMGM